MTTEVEDFLEGGIDPTSFAAADIPTPNLNSVNPQWIREEALRAAIEIARQAPGTYKNADLIIGEATKVEAYLKGECNNG